MPWIELGREIFEMEEVSRLTKGVPSESGVPSVKVLMNDGSALEYKGEEARLFLEKFREFRQVRWFGVPPPGGGARVMADASDVSEVGGPGQAVGVEEGGVLGRHFASDDL